MKVKKKKKGFTLVELIIVIVIIGVLAAVLIPAISGYVTKAKRGKDVELAGNMTTEVSLYCSKYGVDMEDLTGVDVRTILLFHDNNLKPRTNKWVFVYDRTNRQVVVRDIVNGVIKFTEEEIQPSIPKDPIDPTHIAENYFLISKGNSAIERAVDLMVNFESDKDFDEAMDFLKDENEEGYKSVIEKFNPETTLFIDNGGAYTAATTQSVEAIKRIVVLELTSCLPALQEFEIEIEEGSEKVTVTYLYFLSSKFKFDRVYSNTIRTSEPDSQLKSIFKNVSDIDFSKVKTIALPAFGPNREIKMGALFDESYKQVIADEILSYKTIETNGRLIVNRKLTVSYYNQDGLFARGSVIYAIVQNAPTTK
jgi:prepilin-type N-terminal cleavage/methylation domain-containing protein